VTDEVLSTSNFYTFKYYHHISRTGSFNVVASQASLILLCSTVNRRAEAQSRKLRMSDSTHNPHRLQGVGLNRTDTRKPASARSRSESHPPATPGSEAADLSTLGLSESPRAHFVNQPSSTRSHFVNQPRSPLPFRQSAQLFVLSPSR